MPGDQRPDRGRRDHGRSAPRAPGRGRAVSSRVGAHRARPCAAEEFSELEFVRNHDVILRTKQRTQCACAPAWPKNLILPELGTVRSFAEFILERSEGLRMTSGTK